MQYFVASKLPCDFGKNNYRVYLKKLGLMCKMKIYLFLFKVLDQSSVLQKSIVLVEAKFFPCPIRCIRNSRLQHDAASFLKLAFSNQAPIVLGDYIMQGFLLLLLLLINNLLHIFSVKNLTFFEVCHLAKNVDKTKNLLTLLARCRLGSIFYFV